MDNKALMIVRDWYLDAYKKFENVVVKETE